MREEIEHLVYAHDAWEVDVARRELRASGVTVPLGSRAFDIFVALIQSAGKLVTKDELMGLVWPSSIVEDNKLQVHISGLRRALGPDRTMLKTSFGQGYWLLGEWTCRQASSPRDFEGCRRSGPPFASNVPAATSELINRTAAVQHLQDCLSSSRAITLTGPGGIGKTALALEFARSLEPSFQGDRMVVDLICQLDPALVPTTVASGLGLKPGGDEMSAEIIARAIGARTLLLVLDNCEHVVDAAARLVETILHLCPAVSVVATSREILRIEGENVYRVPPLDVPIHDEEDVETVLGYGAVKLFLARASALDSEFFLRDESLRAIATICRRLDGIPLAIEFAAARAAALGPELVLSHLEKRFELLGGGHRTALPRQQTLRATLDWSYDLLSKPEQRLLRRLGVFAAGFTLEAANAVMRDKGYAASFLLEQIANLVAKSLVTLDRSIPAGRWRLLDTTRDYALEKLAESGDFEQAARLCVEYFRDLVRPAMHGSQVQPSAEDMARFGQELDNVRACLDWSFSPAGDPTLGIVLTAGYAPVWLGLSLVTECRERVERALEYLDTDPNLNAALRVQLYVALGTALVYTMGSNERIRVLLSKALDAAKSLDDAGAVLEIHFLSWGVYFHSGDCREAQAIAERFEQIALRAGDPALIPVAHRLIANCLHYGGRQRDAQHRFERMLAAHTSPVYRRHTIWSRYDLRFLGQAALARVLWLRGLVDQGIQLAQASFEGAQESNHKPTLCWVLHYGAYPFALLRGDMVAAEQAVAMLMELATSLSAPFWKTLAHCLQGKLLIRRGEFAQGSVLLRRALDICEKTGWTLCYPEFLGVLAEGLAGQGQFTEALAAIDEALARAGRGGERLFVAELHRAKGEIMLRSTGDRSIEAAERCFNEALETARAQDALSLELRAALTFAHFWIKQDRHEDAKQLLAQVYDRFTEGFGSPDLLSAKAMLQSLQTSPVNLAN